MILAASVSQLVEPSRARMLFFWICVGISAASLIGLLINLMWIALSAIARKPGHCPKCRYNLTGNRSGICPECGHPVSHS
jgi:hypothetical protein